MSTAGIIFSNIHDSNLPELTRMRTMGSVPFGCRYRLIDFALSNMVNSNIFDINVITHYNYHSLMDHIGSGKDWDLARRSGGVKLLPPFISAYDNGPNMQYSTRLEALKSISNAISQFTDDYVVLSDCDIICNIDLNEVIRDHIANTADITVVVKRMYLTQESARSNVLFEADESGRITDVYTNPSNFSGYADVCLNISVISRRYLQSFVLDAIAHNYTSLTHDIMARSLKTRNYRIYKYDGYFASVSSFADYFSHSMELIRDREAHNALFGNRNRPIYTKIRNSPPTYYAEGSCVRNSLIADGCRIYGEVENSILFRGVKIGKNSRIKNSILFQDTFVGENVTLNCVVSDKNVVIRDGRTLSGHESLPYYINKGKLL